MAMNDLAPVGGDTFRCGFVAVVGRPNVGKSSLVNALVGQKVTITADKAQTTRHRIHGICTDRQSQFVFVDTPGYQTRHGGALNRAMNRSVITALGSVDCVLLVVESMKFADADQLVLDRIPEGVPVILVVSKSDLVKPREALLPFVATVVEKTCELRRFSAVVPVSTIGKHRQPSLEALLGEVRLHLPIAPALFDADDFTDRSSRFLASEAIREKVFRLVGDELPYRMTVVIDKFEESPELQRILATVMVDNDGHRRIMIGAGGERIKRIASEARADLQKLFGTAVYLEVWVKVKGGWADSEAAVRAFGHD
jgi:GTP-binding protein Era